MSPGADAGEFSLAHVVAFQHAILHTIFGGDGFHDLKADDTRAVSPRTRAHTFYSRRKAIIRTAWRQRKVSEVILRMSVMSKGAEISADPTCELSDEIP